MNKNYLSIMFLIIAMSLLIPSLQMNTTHAVTYYELNIINSSPDMGTISPSVGTYWIQNNTQLTITAYPYDGYVFAGFIRATPGIQLVYSYVNPLICTPQFTGGMTPELNITVLWSPAIVYLNVLTALNGTTNPTGLNDYTAMEQVTITAYPDVGYFLEYWLIDDYAIIAWPHVTTNQTTVTMIGNHTVTPVFTHVVVNPVFAFNFIPIIPPMIIVGILGFSFSQIGNQLGEHAYAGFCIGGAMGLLICANSGLIPVWFVTVVFTCGFVGIYFWSRG